MSEIICPRSLSEDALRPVSLEEFRRASAPPVGAVVSLKKTKASSPASVTFDASGATGCAYAVVKGRH